jgi:hypothetical protein
MSSGQLGTLTCHVTPQGAPFPFVLLDLSVSDRPKNDDFRNHSTKQLFIRCRIRLSLITLALLTIRRSSSQLLVECTT